MKRNKISLAHPHPLGKQAKKIQLPATKKFRQRRNFLVAAGPGIEPG